MYLSTCYLTNHYIVNMQLFTVVHTVPITVRFPFLRLRMKKRTTQTKKTRKQPSMIQRRKWPTSILKTNRSNTIPIATTTAVTPSTASRSWQTSAWRQRASSRIWLSPNGSGISGITLHVTKNVRANHSGRWTSLCPSEHLFT